MKKLFRATAIAVALAASGVGLTPAAHAAVNDNTCDSAEVCAFSGSNYGGGAFDDIATTDANWTNNRYGTAGIYVNDTASSGFAIDRAMQFWVDINFKGPFFTLPVDYYDACWCMAQPGRGSTPASFDFNDTISSNAVVVGQN